MQEERKVGIKQGIIVEQAKIYIFCLSLSMFFRSEIADRLQCDINNNGYISLEVVRVLTDGNRSTYSTSIQPADWHLRLYHCSILRYMPKFTLRASVEGIGGKGLVGEGRTGRDEKNEDKETADTN